MAKKQTSVIPYLHELPVDFCGCSPAPRMLETKRQLYFQPSFPPSDNPLTRTNEELDNGLGRTWLGFNRYRNVIAHLAAPKNIFKRMYLVIRSLLISQKTCN